jgi:hypothetical protein
VCDLGLQDLTRVVPKNFDSIAKHFAELCGEPNVSLAECRTSAEMWRTLNREIISLDIVGNDSSLVHFDLNTDRVPAELKNHFDFVTNVGTTEHVFNQMNCFTVLHDLVKVGGIMAHAVPSAGFENHGLFNYPLKFFTRIARDNDYECLDAWMSVDFKSIQFKPDVADFLQDNQKMFKNARSSEHHPIYFYNLSFAEYGSSDSCLYVFLRKTHSGPFRTPIDLPE